MIEEELKKRRIQYMKAQLEQTFNMNKIFVSSKSSTKSSTMDDLLASQDPVEDELSADELYLQIMKRQKWTRHVRLHH